MVVEKDERERSTHRKHMRGLNFLSSHNQWCLKPGVLRSASLPGIDPRGHCTAPRKKASK